MKIYYYDFVATNGVHTTFNSAMIEVLKQVFPESDNVVLYSEKKHGEIVSDKCNGCIKLKPLKFLFSKVIRFSKIRDMLSILFILPKLFFASRKDVIYVGLAFPFTIIFLNLFTKILRKKIYITLHGELQYYLDCDSRYYEIKHKKYFCSTKHVFGNYNRFISWIVLGEPIYSAIHFIFNERNKVIVINHPAIFKENIPENITIRKPLTVGIIGGGLNRKGVDSIFLIASFLENEIKENKVILKICGMYNGQTKSPYKNLVKYYDKVLSEEELSQEIETLDYSLQLTTDNICKAVASGTLIDSLIFNKPVIGLHSSYLDFYMVSDESCFENEQEIANKIKRVMAQKQLYIKDVEDNIVMREKFSVKNNAILFKSQLENSK